MQAPRRSGSMHPRAAAALVEAAIVLPTFLILLFGMLDMALCLLRNNSLSDAVRRGARSAMVHGAKSETPLGPSRWDGNAAQSNPVAAAMRPYLTTMLPQDVQVRVSWPDASNRVDRQVSVHATYRHQSVVAALLGGAPLTLTATSTMQIAH